MRKHIAIYLGLALVGCDEGDNELSDSTTVVEASTGSSWNDGLEAIARPAAPENISPYDFANGCYVMDMSFPDDDEPRWLKINEGGDGFVFSATNPADATPFFLKPADLGTYLFFDPEGAYLIGEELGLGRRSELLSDLILADDSFVSPAEWLLERSSHDEKRFQLKHRKEALFLGPMGLVEESADGGAVTLYPAEGCTAHPELSLDAEGTVTPSHFEDGSLFGIVDTHSHLLSNFGFGGAGLFHGAPFHRLGVAHALPDCEVFHGEEGRKDLFGFADERGGDFTTEDLIATFVTGMTPEFNHHTEGYPEFTQWPNAREAPSHQTQYYRWLERAWMGGLRLVIQHATSNSIICELMVGNAIQPTRYSCNDMVAVDRIIEETYAMERYIDAQNGGPGKGFFRVVTSPERAREVIGEGKMAVILGIETSNLFDCFSVPKAGFEVCDEAMVTAKLDDYYSRGVRVMFPVHKYDNHFSAGDGMRGMIELGNFINTGHPSSFTQDCIEGSPAVYDKGRVSFGGINEPRDNFFADPPHDMSTFIEDPLSTLLPFLDRFTEGSLSGDWCQTHGLTPLGEHLLREMMARGMLIEMDHFPQRAYDRAFEILKENDYPGVGTHGSNFDGKIYELGGVSRTGFRRCHDPDNPGGSLDNFRRRVEKISEQGGYPAEGFGFDLNGFAGAPGPRFGEKSGCDTPQSNPVTYPFTSYGGDVTFTEPRAGMRAFDFNEEGMVHIGLLPELIQDARNDGVSDEDLEMLFRSAEGYIRMWERAEARASAMP